ncbi:hypothetical protein PAESOLCIP111_01602 [Paenibacillus solanacearum]|uniref:Uncharacterized protein n=1 Tax=Paenibacillus solanacearum TaxID=2048548 RepID=A0A916NNJ9_9BACL|nr:hypothetical protein PAESOLCIP111_01602 [Paenibacillus solanacearum]
MEDVDYDCYISENLLHIIDVRVRRTYKIE